jgi:hypothetical protein
MAKVGEAAQRLSQLEAKSAKRQVIRVMQEVVRRRKAIARAMRAIDEWHAREVWGKWFAWLKKEMAAGKRMRVVSTIIERKALNQAF